MKETQGYNSFVEKEKNMKDFRYEGERVVLKIGQYSPMVMSIEMLFVEENEYEELTKNFGNFVGNDPFTGSFIRKNCAFIDTNNCPGAEEMLKEIGAKPYTKFGSPVTIRSGFCEYPLYEFPESLLREMDEKGYEKHSKSYDAALPKEQRKLNKKCFG